MLSEQGRELAARAPELIERIEESRLVGWADRQFGLLDRVQSAISELLGDVAEPALAVAKGVLGGLAGVVTVVVLSEGRRVPSGRRNGHAPWNAR